MATSSMASAAAGFVVAPAISSAGNSRPVSVFFPKSTRRSFVIRAEEGAAPAPAAPAETGSVTAEAPKPPPVGPKRGTKVCDSFLSFLSPVSPSASQ